ncbi:MAG: hypothetical protein K0R65_2627 [Crocinitomicaceae bacterium]|jgi:hypothetical protein|nr:hypothetical protein [Crocinitomicaceae bacterium]
MRKIGCGLLMFISFIGYGQKSQSVITDDIQNFWKAYEQILITGDSLKKIEIIQTQYIDKGTEGLKSIMQARRYTAAEYIQAIEHYPLFWKSVRENTLKVSSYARELEKGIKRLKKIYPGLKPAKIYFTIGALRTVGTTLDDKVLIGAEIAMADDQVVTSEFGEYLSHLPSYFAANPLKNLTFLNIHEYIHTQQKTTIGNTLLAQTIIEGAAEFVAATALQINSPNEQVTFGKLNDEKIKKAYVKEMFSTNFNNWIWNSPDNEFHMRDLGYYVGYAICEKYYALAHDKKQAVKHMIELDYNDREQLIRFVEASGYFEQDLSVYEKEFEASRPVIVKIEPFENGKSDVDAGIKKVTLHFSQPMNKSSADFDIGPLGDQHVMWLEKRLGFSADGKSYSFEIKSLVPGMRYQLLVTGDFTNSSGIPLKPYLIDIETSK